MKNMKKSIVGWLGIILGTLVLSIEFYALHFLHMFALANGFEWLGALKDTAIEYLFEPVICIAFLLTVSVIIISAVLIYMDSR